MTVRHLTVENASVGGTLADGIVTAGLVNGTMIPADHVTIPGNGHAGFDVHAHAPGLNFSGNVVAGNRIGVNNLRTSEGDALATGVYLGDASPLSITVTGNVIARDHYGVFAAGGPVTVTGLRANTYRQVAAVLGTSPTF